MRTSTGITQKDLRSYFKDLSTNHLDPAVFSEHFEAMFELPRLPSYDFANFLGDCRRALENENSPFETRMQCLMVVRDNFERWQKRIACNEVLSTSSTTRVLRAISSFKLKPSENLLALLDRSLEQNLRKFWPDKLAWALHYCHEIRKHYYTDEPAFKTLNSMLRKIQTEIETRDSDGPENTYTLDTQAILEEVYVAMNWPCHFDKNGFFQKEAANPQPSHQSPSRPAGANGSAEPPAPR